MDIASLVRRSGRTAVAFAFAVAAVSVTSPETAFAKHGNGAAIALGILGGALAGAAIAGSPPPAYYAAPPVYYYPYPAPAYSVAPGPAYYYPAPPAAYYPPVPYSGPNYYYGDDD